MWQVLFDLLHFVCLLVSVPSRILHRVINELGLLVRD
jgi:hypothetical protein